MPTVISHSIVGAGIASFFRIADKKKLIIASILLAALPDLDTILMGIFGRESIFRHRGFMHSIFFAILAGFVAAYVFKQKKWIEPKQFLKLGILFFIVTFSHPCLDGFSTGWKYGVGYLAPFDNTRYFLWMSPLPLAPLSPEHLFSQRGIDLFLIEMSMLWTFGFGAILWNKVSTKPYLKLIALVLWMICVAVWTVRGIFAPQLFQNQAQTRSALKLGNYSSLRHN